MLNQQILYLKGELNKVETQASNLENKFRKSQSDHLATKQKVLKLTNEIEAGESIFKHWIPKSIYCIIIYFCSKIIW